MALLFSLFAHVTRLRLVVLTDLAKSEKDDLKFILNVNCNRNYAGIEWIRIGKQFENFRYNRDHFLAKNYHRCTVVETPGGGGGSDSKLLDFELLDFSNYFFQLPGLPGGLEFKVRLGKVVFQRNGPVN